MYNKVDIFRASCNKADSSVVNEDSFRRQLRGVSILTVTASPSLKTSTIPPTIKPSKAPIYKPSTKPTIAPIYKPSLQPVNAPTYKPSMGPIIKVINFAASSTQKPSTQIVGPVVCIQRFLCMRGNNIQYVD